jgi:hypothetical protein
MARSSTISTFMGAKVYAEASLKKGWKIRGHGGAQSSQLRRGLKAFLVRY